MRANCEKKSSRKVSWFALPMLELNAVTLFCSPITKRKEMISLNYFVYSWQTGEACE